MANILTRVFGSRNERLLSQLSKTVDRINDLEEGIKALNDEQFSAKSAEFRERLEGEETLDDLLPEAFAVAREAAWRSLGLRPFDAQLEDADSGYCVEGFVSPPSLHRANRTYMTFFVNRRWIQNRMLSFALEEAYHGLLPDKRYPLAAVNLSLPYNEVDVNSHPAKREVRFHQDGKVFSTLQRAVRAAVVADLPVPQVQLSG